MNFKGENVNINKYFDFSIDLDNGLEKLKKLKTTKYKPTTISTCIMVKNEKRCIRRCIESIKGFSDEIIIIDTGSTDGTLKILEDYNNLKLYKHRFQNNFSEIRNLLIKYATKEWIFIIDADEECTDQFHKIKLLLGQIPEINVPIILSPTIENKNKSLLKNTQRIFKNNKKVQYYGLIHEELTFNLIKDSFLNIPLTLKIKHDGYEKKVMNEKLKLKRNIKLLYKAIEDDPKSLRWRFFLSRELIFFNEKNRIIKEIRENSKQLLFLFEMKEKNYYHLGILLNLLQMGFILTDKELIRKSIQKIEEEYPNSIDVLYYKFFFIKELFRKSFLDIQNKYFEIKETNYLSVTGNGKELYEKEVEKIEKMFQ